MMCAFRQHDSREAYHMSGRFVTSNFGVFSAPGYPLLSGSKRTKSNFKR
jgi:hypothetical protein